MIQITKTQGSSVETRYFPHTTRGQQQATKWIQELHDAQKRNRWFYLMDRIQRRQVIIDSQWNYNSDKARQARREIRDLMDERAVFIAANGLTKPDPITVKIETT